MRAAGLTYEMRIYCSLLNRGIEWALQKEGVSLIETLVLVLKEEANNYPGLIDLAIHKSKTNENIKRALYSKLRHVREDVRDYRFSYSNLNNRGLFYRSRRRYLSVLCGGVFVPGRIAPQDEFPCFRTQCPGFKPWFA